MSLFVRKIRKAVWLRTRIREGEHVCADAITGSDLRTTSNALSVWEVQSESDLGEAVLAIAAAAHHLESFDVVPMQPSVLDAGRIAWQASEGRTPVNDLKENHRDLVDLTYPDIGTIAYHIVDKFKEDRVKRFTRRRQKLILQSAISSGRLRIEDLQPSVRHGLDL